MSRPDYGSSQPAKVNSADNEDDDDEEVESKKANIEATSDEED